LRLARLDPHGCGAGGAPTTCSLTQPVAVAANLPLLAPLAPLGWAGKKTTDHGTPATTIYGQMLLHPHGKTARHVPGPPRDRQRDAARQQASRGSGQQSVGLGSAEAAPHPPEAGPPGHHLPQSVPTRIRVPDFTVHTAVLVTILNQQYCGNSHHTDAIILPR